RLRPAPFPKVPPPPMDVLPADALQADDPPAASTAADALRAAVPTASTARLAAVVTSVAEKIEVASVVAPFRAADAVAWTAARVPPVVPAPAVAALASPVPAVAALASPVPAVASVVPAPAETLHLLMAVQRALSDPPAADRHAPRAPGRGRPRRRAHGTKGDCDSERPSRRAMKMRLPEKR